MAIREFEIAYKWVNESKMVSPTGKNAHTDIHVKVIEAGNYNAAVKKLHEHIANTTLGRKIQVIGEMPLMK